MTKKQNQNNAKPLEPLEIESLTESKFVNGDLSTITTRDYFLNSETNSSPGPSNDNLPQITLRLWLCENVSREPSNISQAAELCFPQNCGIISELFFKALNL